MLRKVLVLECLEHLQKWIFGMKMCGSTVGCKGMVNVNSCVVETRDIMLYGVDCSNPEDAYSMT